jgi:serine/threonine protein kinase
MPLRAGTRLGTYEVIAPLGSGGMGEVYRAHDPKLDRDVAIKVLPDLFAADSDARARFEREAQAVAALSHPNILAIYDFGAQGQTAFAVMELLDGETLRARLSEGALPVRKAIDFAIQVAHGLAAAHDKGIVHRDLKPENVFITRNERVKILDFGLARQLATNRALSAGITQAATVGAGTEAGTVLGTVGYMSPEQVRGDNADTRSDIFSFGVVLYELLTGARAYSRETAAETMTAILKEEPAEIATLAPAVPPGVQRIVQRCLEKRPDARFRSAEDLAFALEAVSDRSPSSAPATTPVRRVSTSAPRRLLFAAAAAIAAALLAGGGYAAGRRSASSSSSAPMPSPPTFQRLTYNRGYVASARFAPDGRTVVYGASWDGGPLRTYLTRLESPESTPLALPNAHLFAVSGGAELAVGLNVGLTGRNRTAGTLARTPLLGGTPRDMASDVMEADWTPDSGSLAVVRRVGTRERLEFPLGQTLYETEGQIGMMRVSPAGDRVAFLDWPVKGDDRGTIAVVDRQGTKQTITETYSAIDGLAWSPDGGEIWFTGSKSSGAKSLGAATLSGHERPLLTSPVDLSLRDVSRDGRALLVHESRTILVTGRVNDEPSERDLSWLDYSFVRDLTRDGRRILLSYAGEGSGANYITYLRSTEGSAAVHLGEGQAQQFSPDEQWVLAIQFGPPSRVVLLPTGAGQPQTVGTGNIAASTAAWCPDGKRIVVVGALPGGRTRAYLVTLTGGEPRAISPEGVGYLSNRIAVAPDGSGAVFASPEGVTSLYPLDGGTPRALSGFSRGELPFAFTGDGRGLLIGNPANRRVIERVDVATGRRERWKEIQPLYPQANVSGGPFFTPDGRTHFASYQRYQLTLYLVNGLK